MPRTVYCLYLKRDAEGLERSPYPGRTRQAHLREHLRGSLGSEWVRHQTMLINEYRLSPDRAEGAQVPRRGDGEVPVRGRLRQAGRVRRSRIRRDLTRRPARFIGRRCARAAASSTQAAMNDSPPDRRHHAERARRAERDQVDRAGEAARCPRVIAIADLAASGVVAARLADRADQHQAERVQQLVQHAGLVARELLRLEPRRQQVRAERAEDRRRATSAAPRS